MFKSILATRECILATRECILATRESILATRECILATRELGECCVVKRPTCACIHCKSTYSTLVAST